MYPVPVAGPLTDVRPAFRALVRRVGAPIIAGDALYVASHSSQGTAA
jgi:hypothetical protein